MGVVEILDQLKQAGFDVAQLNGYQIRVNRTFDFWLNDRGKPLCWHDRFIGDQGYKPADQIVHFIKARFENRKAEVK